MENKKRLIDAIEKEKPYLPTEDYEVGYNNGLTMAQTIILATDNNVGHKWIPVTERLPERGQIVLVCGSRKGIYTAEFRMDGKYPYFHKLNSKTHWCEPTHWMPLPQPPKGE